MNEKHYLLSSFHNSEIKEEYFRNIQIKEKIILLQLLEKKEIKKLFSKLQFEELEEIFSYLDPDEITDILQELDLKKRNKILLKLNKDIKIKVDKLLEFSPRSAAGIMNLNYILIEINTSKKEILDKIEKHIKNGKKEPTIFIIDENRKLLGEIKISDILFEKNFYEKLKQLPTVKYNLEHESCISIFKQHRQEKIVVLDEKDQIIGFIRAKDILGVIEKKNTEDFFQISGLHKEEDITDLALEKVRFRFRWLFINLITAFLAAIVISMFEETISKFVILAAFMPIIVAMGGNAGTQTVAILVRSMALEKIDSKLAQKIIINEFLASLVNGTIIGLIVGLIAYLSGQSPLFGVVVGMASLVTIIFAVVFGTLVPLILKSFNIDPASSSTVFVITCADIFGFFILLSLATLILI